MKGMKPDLLLPFMGLSFSLLLHSDLYGQAKEYTPQQPMSADAIPKADVITQVLPDRRVIFRLKAPDAQAVSVLVHQVRDWFSGAAAYFGWMREAKRENTRCGVRRRKLCERRCIRSGESKRLSPSRGLSTGYGHGFTNRSEKMYSESQSRKAKPA